MREAFQETLNGIKGQSDVLRDRDEKAVEFAVVLPLLQQLGWSTHIVTEVYPQRKLSTSQRPDFELQVDSESRVVIEVKKWAADLNHDNESQLQGYCREVNPSLAALTNGHRWWFYVGPWKRPRGGELRPFLDIDIGGDPEEVESNFWRFLARENLAGQQDVRHTVAAAKELRTTEQRRAEVMRKLTEVWNDLETDERGLIEVVKILAESHGVHPSDQDVKEFVQKSGPLVNQASSSTKKAGADHSKPASFTVKKAGEEPFREAVKNWTGVRLGVCRLMLKRNEEAFRQFASERPDWFPDAPGQHRQELETGIFIPTGGTRHGIINVCHEILARLGYPKETLEIQMNGD